MAKPVIVVGPESEDSELRIPCERLRKAGHDVTLLGVTAGMQVQGKRGKDKDTIDTSPADCSPSEFDAMVIPGGHSPDNIRTNADVTP